MSTGSPDPVWIAIFFNFGAMFGSFVNVLILRIPKGESIVTPASHCVACGKAIAWYDNIPLISWLVLRGRCRSCKARFSFRYWLVELITALLFALSYWKFGFNVSTVERVLF